METELLRGAHKKDNCTTSTSCKTGNINTGTGAQGTCAISILGVTHNPSGQGPQKSLITLKLPLFGAGASRQPTEILSNILFSDSIFNMRVGTTFYHLSTAHLPSFTSTA